jgi:hypothetical protein
MDKYRKQIATPLPRGRPPTKTVWEHRITKSRSRAKKSDLTFDLDAAYIEQLFKEQCGKCAISGLPLEVGLISPTASLDRVESHRGYVKGNVQWVHKAVNEMKWNYDEAYFIAMCIQVAAHRGGGTELTESERRALAGQKQISTDQILSLRGFNRFVKKRPKAEQSISMGGMIL